MASRPTDTLLRAFVITAALWGVATPVNAWWVRPGSGKVRFELATDSVPEGASGDIIKKVIVKRVEGSSGPCKVSYSATNVSATGADYVLAAGEVEWAPGNADDKEIDVTIKHDLQTEPNETFTITLSDPVGTVLDTPYVTTITILDNDNCVDKNQNPCPCGTSGCSSSGAITFSKELFSGTEDTPVPQANGTIVIELLRQGTATGAVTVEFRTITGGTAVAGTDYTANSGEIVTWADGDTSTKTVNVISLHDLKDEPDETIKMEIRNPTGGATLGTIRNADGIIMDNDAEPSVTLSGPVPVSADEGSGGGERQVRFTAVLSATSGWNITVPFQVSGTATSGDDYDLEPLTATFPPDQTQAHIDAMVQKDDLYEDSETIIVTLQDGDNVALGGTVVKTHTIQNDDDMPTVAVSGLNGSPKIEGLGETSCTVSLSEPSGKSVVVTLSTSGTATISKDYQLTGSLSVTFTPGQTEHVIGLWTKQDELNEDAETVQLLISNVQGATVSGDRTSVYEILDDDADKIPVASMSGPYPSEGNEGEIAEFDISLSRPSGKTVRVYYSPDGTATNEADYQLGPASYFDFAPENTYTIIMMETIQDGMDEFDEWARLSITSAQNATVDPEGTQTNAYLIHDMDPLSSVSLTVASPSMLEASGGTTATITLQPPSGKQVSVGYTTWNAPTVSVREDGTNIERWYSDDTQTTFSLSLDPEIGEVVKASRLSGSWDQWFIIGDQEDGGLNALEDAWNDSRNTSLAFWIRGDVTEVTVHGVSGYGASMLQYIFANGTNSYITDEHVVIYLGPLDPNRWNRFERNLKEDWDAYVDKIWLTTNGLMFQPRLYGGGDVFVDDVRISNPFIAEAGLDYQETTGIVVFQPGETSVEVPIPFNDDLLDEESEHFDFGIFTPEGANADLSVLTTVSLTILDDDEAPTATVTGENPVPEGDYSTTFTVQLSGPSSKTIWLDWETTTPVSGFFMADPGTDYILTTGSLGFLPGETTKSISFALLEDGVFEGGEQLQIVLSNPRNVSPDSPYTVTITENEAKPVFSLGGSVIVHETSGTVSLPVTIGGPPLAVPVSVLFNFGPQSAPNKATYDIDYKPTPDDGLSFAPGNPTLKEISFEIINDIVEEGPEVLLVTLDLPQNSLGALSAIHSATITIWDDDSLSYIDIHPEGELVLGLNSTQPFTAVGKSSAGAIRECDPVWDIAGPGLLTSTGRYTSPATDQGEQVEIIAFERANPEIRGSKLVTIDGKPPRIIDLSLYDMDEGPDLLPEGTTSGTVTFTWRLSHDPLEKSPPISYLVLVDDRYEVGRLTSGAAVNSPTTFSLSWNSASIPDGNHWFRVIAKDRHGNSNELHAPTLAFVTENGTGGTGPLPGLDWLLVHQYRSNDGGEFGSWRDFEARPIAELISEAAFAAKTLAGEDMAYISRQPNVWSEQPVKVAQAYHDAIRWLGLQWRAGRIRGFASQAMAAEVFAGAGRLKKRVAHHTGEISAGYDDAVSLIEQFLNGQKPLLQMAFASGGFAKGEESLATRFESMLALRTPLAHSSPVLTELLSKRGVTTPLFDYLTHATPGWVNMPLSDYEDYGSSGLLFAHNLDNLYLSSELMSTLYQVQKRGSNPVVQQLISPVTSFVMSQQDGNGGFGNLAAPEVESNSVDTAAGLYSLVSSRIIGDPALIPAQKIQAAKAYLVGRQHIDSSWTTRALDTAWAVRALRPELIIQKNSIYFDPFTKKITMTVVNRGAWDASGVRVSMFAEDPAGWLPHERGPQRWGVSASSTVITGSEATLEIPITGDSILTEPYFMVDAEEALPEYDDDNNVVSWRLPEQPNLVVNSRGIRARSASGSAPVAGSEWFLDVVVWNVGLMPVPLEDLDVVLRLHEGHPLLDPSQVRPPYGELMSTTMSGKSLDPGASRIVTFRILSTRADLQVARTYNLYVWVDPESGKGANEGEIPESNEKDNIAGVVIKVVPEPPRDATDLVIGDGGVVYQPQPLCVREPGKVWVRVDNRSRTHVEQPFDVSIIHGMFETSRTIRLARLGAGQSALLEFPLMLEEQGSVAVRAVADSSSEVAEQSEENNEQLVTVTAHSCPPSVVDVAVSRDDIAVIVGATDRKAAGALRNPGIQLPADNKFEVALRYLTYNDVGTTVSVADDEVFNFENIPLASGAVEPLSGTPANLEEAVQGRKKLTVQLDATPVRDSEGQPLESTAYLGNNVALREFDFSRTNLRVVDFFAVPEETIVSDPRYYATTVTLTLRVANGDGSAGFETAEPVQLRVWNETTGETVAHWNNLRMPPVVWDGTTTSNLMTMVIEGLPLLPGVHELRARIDSNEYFVETDETDNELSALVTVHEGVNNRPNPDVEVVEGSLRFLPSNSWLVVEATIRHPDEDLEGILALPARNVAVQILREDPGDPGELVPVLYGGEPLVIPELWPGQQITVILPTTVLAGEAATLWVDAREGVMSPERDLSNNRRIIQALPIAPPANLSAVAVFRTVFLSWESPASLDGLRHLQLARWRVEGDQEIFEQAWNVGLSEVSETDKSPTVLPHKSYRYRLRSVAYNGLTSDWVETNVQTGGVPRIELVTGVEFEEPIPANERIWSVLSPDEFITISGSAPGTIVDLVANNAPEPIASTSEAGTSFEFDNLQLTEPLTRFRVVGRREHNGILYTEDSNEVAVSYEKFPDLVFAKDGLVPKVTFEVQQDGIFRPVPDALNLGAFSGSLFKVRVKIKNRNPVPTVKGFDVAFGTTNLEGNQVEKSVRWTDPINSTEIEREVVSGPMRAFNGGSIWIRIDYLEDATGLQVSHGRIVETSESNNYLDFGVTKEGGNLGTEFWVAIPYVFSKFDAYYQPVYDEEFYPQGWGHAESKISLISTLPPGQSQQVQFWNYGWVRKPGGSWWEFERKELPFDNFVPAHGPQITLSGNQGFTWPIPKHDVNLSVDGDPHYRYWKDYHGQPNRREFVYDGCAIRIASTEKFGAYLWTDKQYIPDSCLLFPTKDLGTTYVISNYYASMARDWYGTTSQWSTPAWFQVLATEDNTEVIIRPNHIGVPARNASFYPNSYSNEKPDGSYRIYLAKGQTYVWRSKWKLEDPTGVIIESTDPGKKIGVFAGTYSTVPVRDNSGEDYMFTMVPPVDMLGSEYVIPTAPMIHRGSWRHHPYNQDPRGQTTIPGPWVVLHDDDMSSKTDASDEFAGEAINSLTRIVAFTTTTVTVDPLTTSINLVPGQWLELGENGIVYQAMPNIYWFGNQETGDPYLHHSYDFESVRRIVDSVPRVYRIKSDQPVLAYQYFTSESSPYGRRYVGYDAEGAIAYCMYPGDPSMVLNIPTDKYTDDHLIPFSLLGGMWDNGYYGGQPVPEGWWFPSPRHYITIIAKCGFEGGPVPVDPQVYFTDGPREDRTRRIGKVYGSFPTRTTDWEPVTGDGGRYLGYKICTFFMPTHKDGRHQYHIYNPNGTPLSIRPQGMETHGTCGYPATYEFRKDANPGNDWIDLALDSTSIRFPYSGEKLTPGEPVQVRVEVMNKGKKDVSAANGNRGTLQVYDVRATERIPLLSPDVIPGSGLIAANQLEPYFHEFAFIPTTQTKALYAVVGAPGDINPLNNETTRTISAQTYTSAADLLVESLAVVESGRADSPAQITAVITNQHRHISEEVPVRFTIGRGYDEHDTVELDEFYPTVRFTQDTIVSGGENYFARATIVLPWKAPATGGYWVEAEVNPYGTIEEVDYGNNLAWTPFDISEQRLGNLAVQSFEITSSNEAALEESVSVQAVITSDEIRHWKNVWVHYYDDDTRVRAAEYLGGEIVPDLPASSQITVNATLPIRRIGANRLWIAVNPANTPPEDTQTDNWKRADAQGIEARKPDLTLAPLVDFSPPATVRRGDDVSLSALVGNAGYAAAGAPYKAWILLGSADWRQAAVLSEAILDGTAQERGDKRQLAGTWSTSGLVPGDYSLHLVIDSPDHLAARAQVIGNAPSRTPLPARTLKTISGLSVPAIPASAAGHKWAIDVYATTDTLLLPGEQIAQWWSDSGFRNSTMLETSGTQRIWMTTTSMPLLLHVHADGETQFPPVPGEWPVDLTIADEITTGVMRERMVRTWLPRNDRGQYGSGTWLWIADDGSTYFAERMHMPSQFGTTVTLTSELAMLAGRGEVEEIDESNNVFARSIRINEAVKPNLKVLSVIPAPAEPRTAEAVTLRAAVKNVGAPTGSDFDVRLSYRGLEDPLLNGQVGDDRSLGYSLDHDQVGEVEFTWHPNTLSGSFELEAFADSGGVVSESNENDNKLTTTLTISGTTTLTLQSLLPAYDANSTVTAIANVVSTELSSATLLIDVVAADSHAGVDTFTVTGVPFELGGELGFAGDWNTADQNAGYYYARARLYRLVNGLPQEPPIAVRTDDFLISASKTIACQVWTDRPAYPAGASVRISTRVTNNSINYDFPTIRHQLLVEDREGKTLWPASPVTHSDVGRGNDRDLLYSRFFDLVLDSRMTACVLAFEDENGNNVWDPGEARGEATAQFQYGEENGFAAAADLRDSQGNDLRYTSQTQLRLAVSHLGVEQVTSGTSLMALADTALVGPGLLTRNLMPNADLEELNLSDALAALYWRPAVSGGLDALTRDSVNPWHGSHSLKLTGGAGDYAATLGGANASVVEHGIRVPADTLLTLSFYHRVGKSSDGLMLAVYERNADGALTAVISDYSLHSSVGEWNRSVFTFQTRADTRSVGLRYILRGTGVVDAWLDSIQIEDGRVATSWRPTSGILYPRESLNLLMNPALTLDDGTTWGRYNLLLDSASDEQPDNGIPEAWELSFETTGSSGLISDELPVELMERGLEQALEISAASDTCTLLQKRIPVASGTTVTLSIYAAGEGTVRLFFDEFDATGTEMLASTWSEQTPLITQYGRVMQSLVLTSQTAALGIGVQGVPVSSIRLVAAQLEYGSTANSWVGWAPYTESGAWSVDRPEVEGVKLAQVQLISDAKSLSRRVSSRLLSSNGGLAVADGSWNVWGEAESGTISADRAEALFDANPLSRPAFAAVHTTSIIEMALPARGGVSELFLQFTQPLVNGTAVHLHGAFEPGEWLPLRSVVPAAGSTTCELAHLESSFERYRLEIVYPQSSFGSLAEIELRGWPLPGADSIVYDITPPAVDVERPSQGELVGGADVFELSLRATDHLSGVQGGIFRALQGEIVAITDQPLEKLPSSQMEGALDLTALEDGQATVTLRVWDRAGNLTTAARSILVDRTPPILSWPRFENISTGDAEWFRRSNEVWIRVDADDPTLSPAQVIANLEAFGRTSTEPADMAINGVFSWLVSDDRATTPTDGQVSVPMRAIDLAGNRSETTSTASISDNTSPTVEVAAVEPDPWYSLELFVSGTASDNADGQIGAVQWSADNGTTWHDAVAADGSFDSTFESFTANLSGLADGLTTVAFVAIDRAGNRSLPAETNFEMDAVVPDLAVSIRNLSGTDSEFVRNGDLVEVKAMFDPAKLKSESLRANLANLGGSSSVAAHTLSSGEATWFRAGIVSNPVNGAVWVSVSGRDVLDRATSGTASILADNIVPWAELEAQVPDPVNTNTLTLTGTAFDEPPGRVSKVEFNLNGGPWSEAILTSAPADSSEESFEIHLVSVPEGWNTVRVRVTDAARNRQQSGYAEDTFFVDTIAPEIYNLNLTSLSTSSTEFVKDGDLVQVVALIANGEDLAAEDLTADLTGFGIPGGPASADEYDGAVAVWSRWAAVTDPRDGILTVSVEARDAAGNFDTTHTTIIADNTSPTSMLAWDPEDPISPMRPRVEGTASDEPLGRVHNVLYRTNGTGQWQGVASRDGFNSANETFDIFTTAPIGYTSVQSMAIDAAGNLQDPVTSLTIYVDRTHILEAHMFNQDLYELDPAARQYIRDGQRVGIFVTFDEQTTYGDLLADLTNLGHTQPLVAQDHVTSHSLWGDQVLALDATPDDGVVNAWIYTEDYASTRTRVTITADNTSPTITLDVTHADIVNTNTVVLAGTTVDTGSGVAAVLFSMDGEANTRAGVATDGSFYGTTETFGLLTPELSNGPHVATILAFDRVRNQSRLEHHFIIDTALTTIADVEIHDVDVPSTAVIADSHSAQVRSRLRNPLLRANQIHADLSSLGGSTDTLALSFDRISASWDLQGVITIPDDGLLTVPVWIEFDDGSTTSSLGETCADNTSPTVVLVSVPDFSTQQQITLQGLAQDYYCGTIASVETAVDGPEGPIEGWTGVTASDGVFDSTEEAWQHSYGPFTTTGNRVFKWRTRDLAGHLSEITSVSIFIDPEPPVMVIDHPTSFTWFNAIPVELRWTTLSDDLETSAGSVSWTGFDESVAEHQVVDGERVTSEGRYILQVIGHDYVGNQSETTASAFGIDLTSPTVSVDGATRIAETSVALSGNASDGQPLQSGLSSIAWSLDGSYWVTEVQLSGQVSFAYGFTATGLVPGMNYLRVRALDRAGNVSVYAVLEVEVDQTGPTVDIDVPTTGTWHNQPVTVIWSTEDEDLASSEGLGLWTALQSDELSTYTVASGDLVTSEGLHYITALGTDNLGNVGGASAVQFGIDMTSPVITLLQDGSSPTNTGQVSWIGDAHDFKRSGIANLLYRVGDGDWTTITEILIAPTAEEPTRVTYSFSVTLTHGTHTIDVVALDLAGNLSLLASDSVEVDLQAPQITINAPDANTTQSESFNLEVRVTDSFTGVTSVSVLCRFNQTDELWLTLPRISGDDLDGVYRAAIDSWGLYDGPVTFQIVASDLASNVGTATRTIIIDNDYPPQAPTGILASYSSYTTVTIEFNKNTDPDLARYKLLRKETTGTVTSVRDGNVTDTLATLFNEHGDAVSISTKSYWEYALTALDAAFNESFLSDRWQVTPPATPARLSAIGGNERVHLQWLDVTEGFVKGYILYRSTDGTNFTSHTTVLGKETTNTVDQNSPAAPTNVQNLTQYWYYIVAIDGADNQSLRSNIATAIPDSSRTLRSEVTVMFEDGARRKWIDWDFQDVGLDMRIKLELTDNDEVSTVNVTSFLYRPTATDRYDLYTGISGMAGTGQYTSRVYTQNGTFSTQYSGTYNWNSPVLTQQYVPIFLQIGSGGPITGYKSEIVLKLDNPTSNPLTSFDLAPFDTWMRLNVSGENFDYHIFDPTGNPDYGDNVVVVSSSDPDLPSFPLHFGLAIPKYGWRSAGAPNHKLWETYRSFIEYAKSYRNREVKNANWYENP